MCCLLSSTDSTHSAIAWVDDNWGGIGSYERRCQHRCNTLSSDRSYFIYNVNSLVVFHPEFAARGLTRTTPRLPSRPSALRSSRSRCAASCTLPAHVTKA